MALALLLAGSAVYLANVPGARAGATPLMGLETSRAGGACRAQEISRAPLVVGDSNLVYVEPEAFIANKGQVLLAGSPIFMWKRLKGGEFRQADATGAFGVLMAPSGQVEWIRAPRGVKHIGVVRGAARAGEGWSLVFSEIAPARPKALTGSLLGLWYGELDGNGWHSLQSLPLPAEGRLRMESASQLVTWGDTLVVAVPRDLGGSRSDVALYQKLGDGDWTLLVVPTRVASYVEPVFSDTGELLLIVVEPDWALSSDENSVFLYARRPAWTQFRKLVAGGEEPAHLPLLTRSAEGIVLSWWAEQREATGFRREARAMLHALADQPQPPVTIDSSVVDIVPLTLGKDIRLWSTEHVASGGQSRELRVVSDHGGEPVVLYRTPNPFTGWFAALPTGSDTLVLAGPALGYAGAEGGPVSLLLRLQVQCDSPPAGSHSPRALTPRVRPTLP